MKYIKLFEERIKSRTTYMFGNDMFFVSDVMKYLKVDTLPLDENYKPTSIYDVDVIDFFKEILIDKVIIFSPIDGRGPGTKESITITDKVEDVIYFAYKDDVYIQVKISTPVYNDESWYLLKNHEAIFVKDYDADIKPLHKTVAMKKLAEQYNL